MQIPSEVREALEYYQSLHEPYYTTNCNCDECDRYRAIEFFLATLDTPTPDDPQELYERIAAQTDAADPLFPGE